MGGFCSVCCVEDKIENNWPEEGSISQSNLVSITGDSHTDYYDNRWSAVNLDSSNPITACPPIYSTEEQQSSYGKDAASTSTKYLQSTTVPNVNHSSMKKHDGFLEELKRRTLTRRSNFQHERSNPIIPHKPVYFIKEQLSSPGENHVATQRTSVNQYTTVPNVNHFSPIKKHDGFLEEQKERTVTRRSNVQQEQSKPITTHKSIHFIEEQRRSPGENDVATLRKSLNQNTIVPNVNNFSSIKKHDGFLEEQKEKTVTRRSNVQQEQSNPITTHKSIHFIEEQQRCSGENDVATPRKSIGKHDGFLEEQKERTVTHNTLAINDIRTRSNIANAKYDPNYFKVYSKISVPSLPAYRIFPIPMDDDEYNTIRRKIKNKFIIVHSIERIENRFLELSYSLKKREKLKDFPELEELLLFHGTKWKYVDSICTNNFNWRLHGSGTGHIFGKGVSFSCNAMYSAYYSKDEFSKVMFIAKVLVGKKCVGFSRMNLPEEGYDTSTKEKDSNIVVVKYEDNEFCPIYKIIFNISPDYVPMKKRKTVYYKGN